MNLYLFQSEKSILIAQKKLSIFEKIIGPSKSGQCFLF